MNHKGLGGSGRGLGDIVPGLLAGTEETMKKFRQDCRYLGRDSNVTAPDYKFGTLPPHQPAP
jgi:hypothetical protein